MEFEGLMHIAFICDNFEEMVDFYENKLGFKRKVEVRYKEYLNNMERPAMKKIAEENPDKIYYVYFEIKPGQFIELFPKSNGYKPVTKWGSHAGYNHFALLSKDIKKTHAQFIELNLPTTPISKGPSETWQFWSHDPDGNYFEIMEFTDQSYQVVGHL